MNQDNFLHAIQDKKKIRITFISKQDGREITHICAPMDFGPRRLAHNQADRYHLWDYEGDQRHHILSLLPKQIVAMEVLPDNFSPEEFIAWPTNWFIKRDWGAYS